MAAFVLSNGFGVHRLGITASRKVARRAVDRNRAKRLLREAFRLSGDDLNALKFRYDWVLNAKSPLVAARAGSVIGELKSIIRQVRIEEERAAASSQDESGSDHSPEAL